MTSAEKRDTTKPDSLLGDRLGNYEIRSLIGRGGMARVYEAFDNQLHRRSAIKVVDVPVSDETEITDRFFREARAVANLSHPHIVTVYAFGNERGVYYLAMRYLEGKTLADLLRRHRQQQTHFAPNEMLQIVDDVCSALDYAHEHGIIHRDVKPSNIMVDDKGRAVLMDFGLLLEGGADNTLGTAFGTPRYISPEQALASQQAVRQSDVYSIGIVVYEMLTGRTPFEGGTALELALAHVNQPPPLPSDFVPNIPERAEAVLLKVLAKLPEDRYRTAMDFARALREAYVKADTEKLPETLGFSEAEMLDAIKQHESQPFVSPDLRLILDSSNPSKDTRSQPPTTKPVNQLALIVANQARQSDGAMRKDAPTRRRVPFALLVPIVLIGLAAVLIFGNGQNAASSSSERPPTGQLQLYYDIREKRRFVLFNNGGSEIPFEQLAFKIGSTTDNHEIVTLKDVVPTSIWNDGLRAVPNNACLVLEEEIKPNEPRVLLDVPSVCGSEPLTIRFRSNRRFWEQAYTVYWGKDVLIECTREAKSCDIARVPNP